MSNATHAPSRALASFCPVVRIVPAPTSAPAVATLGRALDRIASAVSVRRNELAALVATHGERAIVDGFLARASKDQARWFRGARANGNLRSQVGAAALCAMLSTWNASGCPGKAPRIA